MSSNSLTQNLGVGVATTVLGLAGGWFMQDSQHRTELADQRASAAQAQKAQEARLHQQELKEKRLSAYKAASDLFQTWQDPSFVEDRRIAMALIDSAGRRNYRDLMTSAATTDRQKQALVRTLEFFDRVRGLAAADTEENPTLNVALARQLFGLAAMSWSRTGLRVLLQNTDDVPPEVENAAYGLAALGYDVSAFAPPLRPEAATQYLSLAPQVSVMPARFAQAAPRATVQPAVLTLVDAPPPAADPGVAQASMDVVGILELKCLRVAFDREHSSKSFEEWRRKLDADRKRELITQCKIRTD